MLNLSGIELTQHELSVLSKGLSFVPSTHFCLFSTILDINRFVRNIMLRKHFKDIPSYSESAVCHNVQNETISFRFDYLVARSALDSLQAESEGGSFGIKESNINIGDKYFYPVQNRNDIVDLFQNIVESDLVKLQELCQQDNNRNTINLTKQETTALNALKMRSDIVIRQADKGGGVL